MLNLLREWTCEDCTDGLDKIAEMFAQPIFIEDSITFLQVRSVLNANDDEDDLNDDDENKDNERDGNDNLTSGRGILWSSP